MAAISLRSDGKDLPRLMYEGVPSLDNNQY